MERLVFLDSRKINSILETAGNGSIELKTGPGSGLDADLLDTRQGSFYLNSSNQNAGTLPTDRLAGTYNISDFWFFWKHYSSCNWY
jgi:hypothetical protein